MTQRVYLDCNATMPILPAAKEAAIAAMEICGNPSSIHAHGRAARAIMEKARYQLSQLAGTTAEKVIFTSGATESNNMALKNLVPRNQSDNQSPKGAYMGKVYVGACDHDSARLAHRECTEISCITNHSKTLGFMNLEELKEQLSKRSSEPALVSVSLVNSETGIIQPLEDIHDLVRHYGAFLHVDAAQALGKISLEFDRWDVDLMSLSAHKIGGLSGCGALLVRQGLYIHGLSSGGGQERWQRAGTENISGIAAFGAAAEALQPQWHKEMSRLELLRNYLEKECKFAFEDMIIVGEFAPRVATTSCLILPAISSQHQLMILDLAGISASAGSACSSGKMDPSHVLSAMGFSQDLVSCAIRISLGWQTEKQDIDKFLATYLVLAHRKNDPSPPLLHQGSLRE